MRSLALVVAASLLIAGLVPFLGSPAHAQAVPTPSLTIYVFGETVAGRQEFVANQILIPQVPINLTVIFHNNDTMAHSFSMDDVNGTRQMDSGLVNPGLSVTLNFTVLSLTRIAYNGTSFTPEAGGGGIAFYCIPHRGAGMIGHILLAGVVTGAVPEKGILLRAYWIGIIGIAAMLFWVIISYFLIKSSSRHFTDHKEHVRKGLP